VSSRQTHSESQQNDGEDKQRDSAKAIVTVPKVNDEHHDHADDWQQDQKRDPDGSDAHIAQANPRPMAADASHVP